MPFEIRKEGSGEKPYCVFTKGKEGKNHGCHETEEKAKKQLSALYANVPEARMSAKKEVSILDELEDAHYSHSTDPATSCASCEYYSGEPDSKTGICQEHRGAAVKADWWCDDWKDNEHPGANMSANFGLTEFTVDGEMVVRKGKIFQTGEYPDRNFSLSQEEAQATCGDFQPVPIDLEHIPTVFDGKLGRCRSLAVNGEGELHGEVEMPLWLHEALGSDPIPVSGSFNRQTKKLDKLSLVVNPRVSDAALMSAYADFANRHDTQHGQRAMQETHDVAVRHGAVCNKPADMASKHEHSALQHVHDHSVEHGAKCDSMNNKMGVYAYYSATDRAQEGGGASMAQETKPSLWEQFKAALGGKDEKPASPVQGEGVDFSAKFAEERKKRISAEATAYAQSLLMDSKITPAEVPGVMASFSQAATDDEEHPATVNFNNGSEEVSGNRVDVLKAQYAGRSPHVLTEEKIPDQAAAAFNLEKTPGASGKQEDGPVDPQRIEKLKGLTPLGNAAIKIEKATNGGSK